MASRQATALAADVLEGRRGYDEVSPEAQTLVRKCWDERFEAARSSLDYAAKVEGQRSTYTELDERGHLRSVRPKS